MLEVHPDTIEIVGPEGARGAPLDPPRPEHEVVHDQLAAAGEQVGQPLRAVRPGEPVILGDLQPGQGATLPAQLVAAAREFLLGLEVPYPGLQPLVPVDDLVGHGVLSHLTAPSMRRLRLARVIGR